MAVRSTKVVLSAQVSGYIASMRAAGKATADALDRGTKLTDKQRTSLNELGNTAGLAGAAAAAGIGLAINRYAEFDQQMSSVRAATHASAADMAALREESIKLGASTQFTAKEAAQGVEELAKAGVSTKDILGGGLKGALDLAAAGGIEVADAAETAASALTQFRLRGEDVPKIADLLAAGAGKAQGSVGDMSAALNQSGLVASQMGLSIDETVGSLTAFASAGLLGSDAGTSFRTMLLALNPKSDEAAALMDKLGFSAYDAQGQFIGMEALAGKLQKSLAGYSAEQRTAALQTLFGQDAIRAANVLYAQGADGIAKWTDKVDDQGYAAETARLKTDNLRGDLERLGGSLDSLLIGVGQGGNGPLRGLVQGLEGVVDVANAAPDGLKSTALAAGALAAGLGLLGFAGTRTITAVASTRSNLATLGVQMSRVVPSAGALNARLMAGVGAFRTYSATGRTATGMLRGFQVAGTGLGGLGKGTAAVTGLALASTSLGDSFGYSNTASFALMGTLLGPWGAAVGGGIGLLKDMAASNNEAVAAQKQLDTAMRDVTGFAAQESALRKLVDVQAEQEKRSKDFGLRTFSPGNLKDFFTSPTGDYDYKETARDVAAARKEMAGARETLAALIADGRGLSDVRADELAGDMEALQKAAPDVQKALKAVGLDMDQIVSGKGLGAAVGGAQWAAAVAAIKSYDTASRSTTGKQKALQDALDGTGDGLSNTAEQADAAKDAIDALISPALAADDAYGAWREGIEKLQSELGKQTKSFSNNTKAGRANRDLLKDSVRDVQDRAKAVLDETGSQEKANRVLRNGRREILDVAKARGLDTREVRKFLRQMGLLPPKKTTKVEVKGVPKAQRSIDDVRRDNIPDKSFRVSMTGVSEARKEAERLGVDVGAALNKIPDEGVNINLTPAAASVMNAANAILPIFKATGGPIAGPGTGTSDDIPAWLSNGEHVLTAREVQAAGGHKVIEQMRRMMLAGQASQLVETPQYRDGGAVVPSASMSGLPNATAGVDSLISGYVRDLSATVSDKVSKALIAAGGRDFDVSGLSGVSDRVTLDGEPLTRITKAQILLAERLSGIAMRVMQGSFQPATSYSGTSHTGPGVADLGPGNFAAQGALRQVALASWGRNFPGAKTAGSGAHTHNVSLLDPGSRNNGQATAFKAGGDGLGGRDYGPNPRPIPGLMMGLRAMGVGLATGGPVEYAGVRDSGGLFPTGSFVANTSGHTEWVLPPDQARHYATGGAVTRSANLVSTGSTAAGNLPWAIAQNTAALTRATAATAANTSATRNQPTVAQASSSLTAERRRQGDVGRAQTALESAQDRYSDAASNRATNLDILNQRRSIRDLSKELNAKGKDRLKGTLNRQIAKAELAEAKAELARMQRSRGDLDRARAALEAAKRNRGRYGSTAAEEQRLAAAEAALEAAQARATAAAEAAQAKAESISQSASDIRSSADLSNLESLSTGSVDRLLATSTANLADFITVMGDLKAANAAPWLLQQLQAAGPTRAAIRLGRQYLSDTSRLATVNARASQYTALSQQWGQMVNDPRWAAGGAWQPNSAAARTALFQISLTDSAAQVQAFRQVVRHEMQTLMPAGEV